MRRLILGGSLITALLVALAAPAGAETTIKPPDGYEVTIRLQVDVFAGKNVRTGADGTRIDQYFKTVINDSWGAAFERLPYKTCFLLKLDLDFKLFDINDEGRTGSHKLYVGTEGRGWMGVGWDGAPKETSRNGDGDGTRSFENDREGDIPADAPPTVVAHEFGHLLGLGDDRKKGAPKDGRDIDTVMVGGVPGADLTQTPRIDQNLIDRIGKVIERHLKDRGKKLPECETVEKPKPEPSSPFPPRAGCTETRGTITYYQGIGGECTGVMFICGENFKVGCDAQLFSRPNTVMTGENGPEVCCDDWKKARQSKEPCDVGVDSDCDGIPNSKDNAPMYKGNTPPPQPPREESIRFFQP